MADTWEQVGAAATGSSGLGSGAGAQQAQNQSWQDAGSAALGGGQSWQDAGSGAAAGGETVGSGAGAVYRDAWAPVVATAGQGWYDKMVGAGRAATMDASGSWQSVGSSAAGGGGGTGPSGEAAANPSTINNGTGGGSGGGGGGGGGGSNVQQPQNPKPPTTSGGSGGSGSGGAAGLLSSLLGTFGGNLLGKSNQLDSSGNQLQLPAYQQAQQLQGLGADTSSFGGLLSNNNQSQQQQQSSSYTPQTINQAATDSFNAFSGNGKAASNSTFSGGIGGSSSESGSSGTGFSGSTPSAYQAMSNEGSQGSQYQQPQSDGTYANPQDAGLGALRQQGIDQGPQMYSSPMQQPALRPSGTGQNLNNQGIPSIIKSNGVQGGVSGDENTPNLNAPKAKPMAAVIDPDYNTPIQMPNPQAQQSAPAPKATPAAVIDPDYNTPISFATEAGREAVQPSPTEAARSAIPGSEGDTKPKPYRVEDAFIWAGDKTGITKNVLKPLGFGVDKALSNIAETVAYPFRTQAQRDETQRSLNADEAQLAKDTNQHPYVAGAAKAVGELAPYLVGSIGGGIAKGTGLLAKVANNAMFSGAVGATQYAATPVDRAINTGMGILLGGVAGGASAAVTGSIKGISSAISSPIVGAAAGAYQGYQYGHGVVDTVEKMVGGAVAGAAGGKLFSKYVMKGEAKGAPSVAAKATGEADTGLQVAPQHQPGVNPALYKAEIDNAQHLKAIGQEQTAADAAKNAARAQAASTLFDSKAEQAAARQAMMKDYLAPKPGMPTSSGPTIAPAAAQDTRGMLRKGIDGTLSAAAPVATLEGTQAITKQPAPQPSGNPIVPPAAPTSPYEAHNAAMLAKLTPQQDVQKFVTQPDPQKPMGVQLQPGAQAAIVKTMPTAKAQAIATDIMRANPADFGKHIDTEKGRKDIYAAVKASGGDAAVKELDALLKERDGLQNYKGPDIKDAKTPLQAVQAKLDQDKYVKAQKEAAKAGTSDAKGTIKQTVQANAEAQQQAPAGAIVMGGQQGGGRSRGMQGSLPQRINALNSRIMVKVLGLMSSLGSGKGSPFYIPGSKSSTWASRQVSSRLKGFS